jgi:hypothetical protein
MMVFIEMKAGMKVLSRGNGTGLLFFVAKVNIVRVHP